MPRGGPAIWIIGCEGQKNADAPCPLGLLRARRERQTNRRATNQCDEIPPQHIGKSLSLCDGQKCENRALRPRKLITPDGLAPLARMG